MVMRGWGWGREGMGSGERRRGEEYRRSNDEQQEEKVQRLKILRRRRRQSKSSIRLRVDRRNKLKRGRVRG